MTRTAPLETGRRFVDRLGVRLGLVIGLALLPVGVMAVMQANDLLAEAQARSEAALAGETLRAVRPTLGLIKRAEGAAEMLAAMGPEAASCAAVERLVSDGAFAFAGFTGPMGGCFAAAAVLRTVSTERGSWRRC